MRKRMVDEFENYNEEGQKFSMMIREMVGPLIKNYMDEDYSVVDIEYIVRKTIELETSFNKLSPKILRSKKSTPYKE